MKEMMKCGEKEQQSQFNRFHKRNKEGSSTLLTLTDTECTAAVPYKSSAGSSSSPSPFIMPSVLVAMRSGPQG